jgi:hypothetical protein
MTEREQLARDIWKAGTGDPDSLAEYLIREGWTKRGPITGGQMASLTVGNSTQIPIQSVGRPLLQDRIR